MEICGYKDMLILVYEVPENNQYSINYILAYIDNSTGG